MRGQGHDALNFQEEEAHKLARRFKVSQTAMVIRLMNLGLLYSDG